MVAPPRGLRPLKPLSIVRGLVPLSLVREAGSRVALVDPSAHEQLPDEDLMEWYEETMKMGEEDVGVCLTNAELASRGHPPQLDGAKQNQLDGEKLVAKSQGGRRLGAGRPIEHIELPNGWQVR